MREKAFDQQLIYDKNNLIFIAQFKGYESTILFRECPNDEEKAGRESLFTPLSINSVLISSALFSPYNFSSIGALF